MRFIAIIDESQLNSYEKSHLLIEGKERNVALTPIHKEMLITTEGHIKCFLDYEQKKTLEEVLNRNPIVGIAEKSE